MMNPTCHNRKLRNRILSDSKAGQSIVDAIGHIPRGVELFGFTAGQFSLIDIVEYCLSATGPADISIMTWAAADSDVARIAELVENNSVLSARFILDMSFKTRKPHIFANIIDIVGAESIRITSIHAKIVLIRNDSWDLIVRGSLNLNFNHRFEQFEISDDSGLADFLSGVFDLIWDDRTASECVAASKAADIRAFTSLSGKKRTETKVVSGYDVFGV
jgi:hypothetical protein